MPEQPCIFIPLDIPDVHVLQTDITQSSEVILTIESTLESTTCHRCGRMITDLHGADKPRLLRHLRLRPKRFRCSYCDDHPTTTQQLDWYGPKALHTNAYERHLIVLLINSTLADVGAKEDVTDDALLGILDRWIATSVDWDRVEQFSVLGIDEIARTKGHRDFVAIISAKSASGRLQVLAVLPDRLKATLIVWLKTISERHRQQICTVCTDMWEGYVTAVREVLSAATIVIDRFHVARHYRDGIDTLRKQEVKRLRVTLPNRSTTNSATSCGRHASTLTQALGRHGPLQG